MSTEVLTLTPEFGLEEGINFRTLITEMEDGKERTRSKWDYGLRDYKLRLFALAQSEMETIWDFYIARKGAYDPFLVKIPTEHQITAEAIGTGNGARTTFTLDEFPVDTSANFTMYVAGSSVSATLTNNFATEFSYVTFASAPGAGTAVTGDYEFYFRVRFLSDRLTRSLIAYQLQSAGMDIKEVRWTYYRPRTGRAQLIFGSVSDEISIAEFTNQYKFRLASEYESVTIAENVATWTSIYHVNVNDSITIAESQSYSPIRINVSDTVSIAEAAAPGTPA